MSDSIPLTSTPITPTLSEAYTQAQANLRTLSNPPSDSTPETLLPLYTRALDSLNVLLTLQSTSGLISPSDFLTELPSSSLPYLFTPFHIASTLQSYPGIDGRAPRLPQSITSYLTFLSSLDHLDALTKPEEKRYQQVKAVVEGEEGDLPQPRSIIDVGQARMDKIARYKEQKALESKLAAYEERMEEKRRRAGHEEEDEEDEEARDYWMQKLRHSIMKSLDDLLITHQELSFLKERDTRLTSPPPPTPTPPPPPSVYQMTPSSLTQPIPAHMQSYLHPLPSRPSRSTVFRDPNPASVSIEEWAEGEMREGRLAGPVRQVGGRGREGYVGRGGGGRGRGRGVGWRG